VDQLTTPVFQGSIGS